MPRTPTTTPPAPAPELWTMRETADYLGVSTDSVRRWIAAGRLRAYRYGPRLVRIDAADVMRARRQIGAGQ